MELQYQFQYYQMRDLQALIIITILCWQYWQCGAIPYGFTINQKYFLVGRHSVSMDQLIQTFTADWTTTPVLVSIPFVAYNSYYSNVYCVSLGDLEISSLGQINIKLSIYSQNYWGYQIQISTSNANLIQTLSIAYFFQTSSSFPYYFYWQNYQYQFRCYRYIHDIGKNITNNSVDSLQMVESIEFTDFSSGLHISPISIFISGIVASSTDTTKTMSVLLAAKLSSEYTVNVTISSSSPIPTYLQYLSYTFCLNSQVSTRIQQLYQRFYIIYSGQLVAQNTNKLSYSNNHLLMNDINTFVGLTSFTISNQNVFSISASVDDQHSLSVSSSIFDKLHMTYFIFYSDYCSFKSPFYILGRCYQTCPQDFTKSAYFECICQYNQQCKYDYLATTQSSIGTMITIYFGSLSILIHLIFIVYFIVENRRKKGLQEVNVQNNQLKGEEGQHISRQEMAINSIDVTLMHLPQINVDEEQEQNGKTI